MLKEPESLSNRVIITSVQEGKRIDSLVFAGLEEFSRTRIQGLISKGDLQVNGQDIKPSYRVQENDVVTFTIPEPERLELEPRAIPLDVIFEDKDIIVINKSRDMVVHPGAGVTDNTLVHALLHHCSDLSGIGGVMRPGIVHRLDRGTSGLIVIAKNDLSHGNLATQFAERTVVKEYHALITGCPQWQERVVEEPVGRSERNRVKMTVTSKGKPAKTAFYLERYCQWGSLVRARIFTGRTHQIRVHLEHLNHSILGDFLYGFKMDNNLPGAFLKAVKQVNGFCLHASHMILKHPVSNEVMEFNVPLPEDMNTVINSLDLKELKKFKTME